MTIHIWHDLEPVRTKIAIPIVFLIVGCSSTPELRKGTLRCGGTSEGAFYGFFSFAKGELTVPLETPDEVDLLLYFDADDCSQGALIGIDDRPGHLFPVGNRPWTELVKLNTPSKDAASVAAISPLTKDKEGLGFWVKTNGGGYILARIRTVQPRSFSDLISGGIAKLELEWCGPELE